MLVRSPAESIVATTNTTSTVLNRAVRTSTVDLFLRSHASSRSQAGRVSAV
jgi:hypothetical protein